MNKNYARYFNLPVLFSLVIFIVGDVGCANMIPPGGGPRDSLPPVLVDAMPKDSVTHFTGNRITLNFDEFVEIQNAFENVIVSPNPVSVPIITARFRTVTIKIKDTLEPNTTYSINFGNALRDINEGNVAKNFTYLFSTGSKLDTNTLSGKVIMAETGKVDTTLIVVLQRSLDDSAVVKERPRYVAKLDGKGNFQFRNLASGIFAVYALPNEYSKRYDDTTKPFAFADSTINSTNNSPLTLYAYQLKKVDAATAKPKSAAATGKVKEDKQLRFQTNFEDGKQSLLKNLELTFNKKIYTFDSTKIT
ncbi:MAG: Ig-like domain-containing protein, partial [Bacteroidota bacterium]|nr:Ig-like domain-containing protein [Bacteroidota bacterium]